MKEAAFIVFLKNFESGKVKTRLARTMGDEAALQIYRKLAAITVRQIRKTEIPVYFYFSTWIDDRFLKDQGVYPDDSFGIYTRIQSGHNLGERMFQAFSEVLASHSSAFILGTDCPYFDAGQMVVAMDHLSFGTDVVIGPAEDGGYYGLGLKEPHDLFSGIKWSTDVVLQKTIDHTQRLGLTYTLLPILADIDEEEDWQDYIKAKTSMD